MFGLSSLANLRKNRPEAGKGFVVVLDHNQRLGADFKTALTRRFHKLEVEELSIGEVSSYRIVLPYLGVYEDDYDQITRIIACLFEEHSVKLSEQANRAAELLS